MTIKKKRRIGFCIYDGRSLLLSFFFSNYSYIHILLPTSLTLEGLEAISPAILQLQ